MFFLWLSLQGTHVGEKKGGGGDGRECYERGRRFFKGTFIRPKMDQNDSILDIHVHVYDDKNVLIEIID